MALQCFALSLLACVLILLVLQLAAVDGSTLRSAQRTHKLTKATNADVRRRLALLSDEQRFKDTLLQPMLRTRVSDTPGNTAVQQHIKGVLGVLGWEVVEDRFTAQTPYGLRTFTNLVATQAPDAPRRLTFACHFDSKNFTNFLFIGATDSAVPCAMLLDMAVTLHQYLFSPANKAVEEVSLQFIFFDGEEAQINWSGTDNTYGSRHLAATMQSTSVLIEREVIVSQLETMDALILLDLIGTSDVSFRNTFAATDKLFCRLQTIEKHLSSDGLLSRSGINFFPEVMLVPSYTEDDHIPFYQRGVPVLHLIPSTFPIVWHSPSDDETCLDYAVINDLNVILRSFAAEYLWLL